MKKEIRANNMIYTPEWPECFLTGEVAYPDTEEGHLCAIVDAHTAWELCHVGFTMPEHFETAMMKISELIKISTTPDIINKAYMEI